MNASSTRRGEVSARVEMFEAVVTPANFDQLALGLRDIEVIFCTWGMWNLSSAQLAAMPNLKTVFYAAGSVRHFAVPLLSRDILVVSAWAANAVPVAQWTVAQILLASKGFFRNTREFRAPQHKATAFSGRGNLDATVSLLGAGQIGRRMVELLRPFETRVLVFDPFLQRENAALLGVEKIESLAEAFERGRVVYNHLANVPATVGMLREQHFKAMPLDATFINTGRGATVREEELIATLQSRPDLTALLDVTNPEPPRADSPLWTMPNVCLTSHIAGSIGDEVWRMADFVLEEFDLWRAGLPLRYSVTPAILETMA